MKREMREGQIYFEYIFRLTGGHEIDSIVDFQQKFFYQSISVNARVEISEDRQRLQPGDRDLKCSV